MRLEHPFQLLQRPAAAAPLGVGLAQRRHIWGHLPKKARRCVCSDQLNSSDQLISSVRGSPRHLALWAGCLGRHPAGMHCNLNATALAS